MSGAFAPFMLEVQVELVRSASSSFAGQSLGLGVHKEYLLWGRKYLNKTCRLMITHIPLTTKTIIFVGS